MYLTLHVFPQQSRLDTDIPSKEKTVSTNSLTYACTWGPYNVTSERITNRHTDERGSL